MSAKGGSAVGGKILILGAKGNLGQQLVKVFSGQENTSATLGAGEVIAWDREEIDITDRELIIKKIDDIKPEVIINAAAYNNVDKCEDSDEEYELAKKVNIDGPKFLAEAGLKVGAILVHYSTNYVFDGEKKEGYIENDEAKPINRYGKTKFHGEKRILEQSGSGLKWYLIRTSKLFGPEGQSKFTKPTFFDTMLESSKTKKVIEVVNEEVSCYTYTPDLAQATKELILSGKGNGIYHLINQGAGSWYQAAVELFNLAGIDIKVVPISSDELKRPAKRPKYSILINTKLPLLRDYREALKEYLNLKQ